MTPMNVRRLVVGCGLLTLCASTLLLFTPLASAGWGGGGSHGGGHGGDDHGGGHDGDHGGGHGHDDGDHDDDDDDDDCDGDGHGHGHDDCDDDDDDDLETTLYVWAGDPARIAPDFLAVIDFDRESCTYGQVLSTVSLPPPNNINNEPHHCGLSEDKNILACGGLLSVLRGQDEVFFFDVSDARHPVFIGSDDPPLSSITDEVVGLPGGGFLVTMMGSASGGAGGKVAEYDANLNRIAEWPAVDPADGMFNPHGMSIRPDLNLMVTADFLNPASTLNAVPGDIEFRHSVRVWDLDTRTIVRTIDIPEAIGTMEVKLIPGDPEGRAITAGMFSGLVYTIDTATGVATQSFDCEDIVPHVETDVDGGMVQLIAMPQSGDRLAYATFQAGQVGLLDISDRYNFVQIGTPVELGFNAGPHAIYTTTDDGRLVVTDYFLNEDDFGKVHLEGDHKVHVINLTHDTIALDPSFDLDFDTAFATPARPHGMAFK